MPRYSSSTQVVKSNATGVRYLFSVRRPPFLIFQGPQAALSDQQLIAVAAASVFRQLMNPPASGQLPLLTSREPEQINYPDTLLWSNSTIRRLTKRRCHYFSSTSHLYISLLFNRKMSTAARRRLMRDFKVRKMPVPFSPPQRCHHQTSQTDSHPTTAHADGSPRWRIGISSG